MVKKTMLTPRPDGSGRIARVLPLEDHGDGVLVLDIDGLHKRPELLKRYNPGYTFATKLWTWVSTLVFFGGIALSFFWHWWAFILGWALSFILYRANQTSAGDFATESIRDNPAAISDFSAAGLTWIAPKAKLMPDNT